MKSDQVRACFKSRDFDFWRGRKDFKTGVYTAVLEDFKIFSTKPGGKRPLLKQALRFSALFSRNNWFFRNTDKLSLWIFATTMTFCMSLGTIGCQASSADEAVVRIRPQSSLEHALADVSKTLRFFHSQNPVGFEILMPSANLVRFHLKIEIPDRIWNASSFFENVFINKQNKLIQLLKGHLLVAYAEPNIYYHTNSIVAPSALLNDPLLPEQWGLENIQFLPARELIIKENLSTQKVKVAVIDSGIDFRHTDLSPAISSVVGTGPELDKTLQDEIGHGTHCAGTIGAVSDNQIGITGINSQVDLVPIKFIGSDGRGNLALAIKAIELARQYKVRVISASWSNEIYSRALEDAVSEAVEVDGILWVASAGNHSYNNDEHSVFPANFGFDNMIVVAASDHEDQLVRLWPGYEKGSNFGPKSVHLAAPGIKILSTFLNSSYESQSGTSMAVPFVAASASLLLSLKPELKALEVKKLLLDSIQPIDDLKDKLISGGRLDIHQAILKLKNN